MILQALGKDPRQRPRYKDMNLPPMAGSVQADAGHWGDNAFSFEAEAEGTQKSAAGHPAPPTGSKVIRVQGKKCSADLPADAPDGFQAVRRKGQSGRAAP